MSAAAPLAGHRPVLADLIPRTVARDVVLVVGAVLLTAASAQVVIPLPFTPVPITGQTFAVLLAGAALGPARGALAMALYWLAGAAGLPFYADAASGVQAAIGATGGYLAGFVLAGLVVGAFARRGLDRNPLGTLAAFVAGSLVIYAVGVPWLAYVLDLPLREAVAAGLLPFVLGDALKALLAAGLLPGAWRLANR